MASAQVRGGVSLPAVAHAFPEDEHYAPLRVLLVEDDPADAFLVEELLGAGVTAFELQWVRGLPEALERVRQADCVLLDLGLPGTEGMDAVRAIVALDRSPAVVVLTGLNDRRAGEQALALGAQDFLTKGSVDEDSLVRAVRYAVARTRGEESNRRLREAELLAAERARLERGLLPKPLLERPDVSCATHYQPGGGRALLGGDFFDGIEHDDGTVRLLIGDVSGHGSDAAAVGIAIRLAWRALVLAGEAPAPTLGTLERLLAIERASDEVFATVLDIELRADLRAARLWTGGHPGPLVCSGAGVEAVEIGRRGPVLGLGGPPAWAPSEIELPDEWTLVAYTDGLIEGRGPGDGRLGEEGLVELAAAAVRDAGDLEQVASRLVAEAESANGGPLQDDVALFLVSNASRWGP